MARTNRQWVLRQRPNGLIQPGDLELVEATLPDLKDAEILVRTIYLSLDPTNRTWMNEAEGYLPAVALGGVMPQAGETLVVSAAAGAVGSIAGQIAKARGARVIGIAGGPDKCRWLTEDLGFDAAIDYKGEDVADALDRLAPDGFEMNFENVGGDIMIAVYNRLKVHGRMAVCGLISSYNATRASPSPNFSRIITHRLDIKGFLVLDYGHRAKEMVAEVGPMLADGRVKWKVHVDDGLEVALDSLNRLFTGDHDGKLLVRVSEEPAA
ncbi:MAG: NADP-dependent oxidoreductase [Brevundimonas sp.]|nr:MAG: NADP-dependent oxidoreductase [Brevundimonas sp.]